MAYFGMTTVLVDDYDTAIGHYVTAMGFTLVEDTDLGGGKRWVVVAPDPRTGARLLLARADGDAQRARIGDQTGGRVGFFLYSDDFATDHARYAAAGVRFDTEPREEEYGTVVVFSDHYGNRWDLIARR
ncbi:glyoxalase/bleomycin resistance protein/dioxygenase superfamily protein [Stackebrandtia albiflava]|uniref:Glyoxalase/bleomycin resistance protein/dioxygenase superfamily protein n=1 Tax=Stackebrandtia albiflava TaxID=406432 RepID=A0A562V1Q6_9ACTN|nr:glyoxalase/bleomycin resistance protein/dioxygenase superfamily protein [Stackebrandtia albiflava]